MHGSVSPQTRDIAMWYNSIYFTLIYVNPKLHKADSDSSETDVAKFDTELLNSPQ